MHTEKANREIFSLSQVTNSIRKTIDDRYPKPYWIKAELIKLNPHPPSGHYYPELVEKKDGIVVAQIRANLWKNEYKAINTKFLEVLKEPLKDGVKILIQAQITYGPVHGLALKILDIDPSYTMGDLEMEKQETIKRIKEEGIFDRNKMLQISLLPQRVAIISVETSKGYADFTRVLETNKWGYKFFHLLFPSILQGENAVDSIIRQLNRVRKVKSHFDVVAIIRGGGDDLGLSCYNNYRLSREIALFPIPVITGIGHATNETVTEMVSFSNAITPTKIAEYLLLKFHDFSNPLQRAEERIVERAIRLISEEKVRFKSEVKLFRSVTENILTDNRSKVKEQASSLLQQSLFRFKNEKNYLFQASVNINLWAMNFCKESKQEISQFILSIKKDISANLKLLNQEINQIEKNVNNMSPQEVLKRGYSITFLNGKSVRVFDQVKEGDTLDTKVFEGNITSIVKSLSKSD